MSWPEVKKGINSDITTPLNDLLYAMDYKMYGEESPVYTSKDRLHAAYMTWYSANSSYWKEALEYAEEINKVGLFLSMKEDTKDLPDIKNYKNFVELGMSRNPEIIDAINISSGPLHFLISDGYISEITLSAEEIKTIYFDENRTDCDSSFPKIIMNNYSDYFCENYENAMELFTKSSFWNNSSWYANNDEWKTNLYNRFKELYNVYNSQTYMSSLSDNNSNQYKVDKKDIPANTDWFILSQYANGTLTATTGASGPSDYRAGASFSASPASIIGNVQHYTASQPVKVDTRKIIIIPRFYGGSISTSVISYASYYGAFASVTASTSFEYITNPPTLKTT